MAEYTLPNGRVIKGLSEGYSPEDIKQIALAGGYATEADYQRNTKTGADWATTLGEAGGGVGGAALGASIGTAVAPVVGTAVGGLVGGALGTFLGSAAGQTVEASLEDRELSTDTLIKNAGEATAVDAAFGLGFGVAGKVIKTIAQPLMRLASPAARAASEADSLLALQGKLEKFDTTLLPSQIGDTSAMSRAAETYAASSLAFKPEYNRIVEGYDNYVRSSTEQIMNKLAGASREDIGKAFKSLTDEVDGAVEKIVDPLYKDIDARGGLVLSSKEIADRMTGYLASTSAGGVGRASQKAQSLLNMVSKLPAEMTPAQLAAEMPQVLATAKKMAETDAQATGMFNILKGYVEKVKASPALVDTSAISASAKGEKIRRVSEEGEVMLSGEYGQAVNYVSGLRRKMSFSEARQELSYLKKKLRDMDSPTSPNSAAASIYSKAVSGLEGAMETSTKNFDPELYGTYRYVSDFYRTAQEAVTAPFIKKALTSNEPAKVGEILAKTGYITPTKELDNLVAFADKLGVKGGKNVREQVTRSYLENIFKTTDAAALSQFNKEMLNPKFRDTFKAVVPQDVAEPLLQLAAEAEVLARHVSGGSAASLSVASREIGAAENPLKLKSLVFGVLPDVVKARYLNNRTITAKLNAMRVVNKQLAAGQEPSKSALSYIIGRLPTTSIPAGFAAGATLEK